VTPLIHAKLAGRVDFLDAMLVKVGRAESIFWKCLG
jgi:hypothetical protein